MERRDEDNMDVFQHRDKERPMVKDEPLVEARKASQLRLMLIAPLERACPAAARRITRMEQRKQHEKTVNPSEGARLIHHTGVVMPRSIAQDIRSLP